MGGELTDFETADAADASRLASEQVHARPRAAISLGSCT